MQQVEHKFANNDGVKIHYVTAGEGEPVMLLHGFPEYWYSWRKQIPALAERFQVIVPDLRGYNRSDKPSGWKNYTSQALTGDIRAIMQAEGLETVRMVAHDWGGAVGWEMAMYHPELLQQLVILNSPHPHIFAKALRHNSKQKRRSWYMLFFQVPLLPDLMLKAATPIFIRQTLKGWAIQKNAFSKAELRKFTRAFRRSVTPALNYYRASFKGRKLDSRPKDGKIKVPTLVVWGQNDKALGPELADDIPKYYDAPVRIERLDNCSHWVQSDQPEKLNQLLLEFFAE